MTAAVEFEGVSKRFGTVAAVDGVDLTIEEGVHDGLQSLDQALLALQQEKRITAEDALGFAEGDRTHRL